jgi:hypothetical protein
MRFYRAPSSLVKTLLSSSSDSHYFMRVQTQQATRKQALRHQPPPNLSNWHARGEMLETRELRPLLAILNVSGPRSLVVRAVMSETPFFWDL